MKTEVPILSTSFSKDARAEPKSKELFLSETFASYYTASKSAVLGGGLQKCVESLGLTFEACRDDSGL